jgi:hypothetical protein
MENKEVVGHNVKFVITCFIVHLHNNIGKRECHQKIRGILSAMCTSSLLDIHELKYDFDTFTEA